MTYSFAGVGMP